MTQESNGQPQPTSGSEEPRKAKQNRSWITFGYALVGVWAVSGAIATGVNHGISQWMERGTQRFLSRMQVILQAEGGKESPNNIIILGIDQESLARKEDYLADPARYPHFEPLQAWPWQRTAYAQVIEKLLDAGARSVSIDLILDSSSLYGPEDDQQLQQMIAAHRDRIVLAVSYEEFGTPESGEIGQLAFPNAVFQVNPPQLGIINFLLDPDGRVYELPENFIERVLRPQGLGGDIDSFSVATLRAAQLDIPNSTTGDIYYYGGPTTFPRVPFWHVLDPTNWAYHLQQQTFKDKIVLIGPLDDTLSDVIATPVSDTMPGIEIHANAIATLMENRIIREAIPSFPLQGCLVFLGVAGTGLALTLRIKKPVTQLLAALGVSATWGFISFGFTTGGLIIPTAVPMGVITLSGLSLLITGSIHNQVEQRRLRQTLERYVAAPIVQEILTHHSHDFQDLLKGRRVKAAVLFCDIRSFTTFSMTVEPEELVEQLNSYLNAMVEAILEAGGTIDKFIGDAIMAEFGSPISQGEKTDALNAVRAALGMRQALADLQQVWKAQGKPILFNGVGINFGEAIAGDIGSYRRREYALIGDAVNIASRVEGMTRQFWTDILITQSLYEWVKEEVEVVDVGEHPLKGRGENRVRLYSLVGWKGDDHTPYKELHGKLRAFKGF